MFRKEDHCLISSRKQDGVILVPYKQLHVPKYHSWMSDPELRSLTASDLLTLDQEYQMQSDWMKQSDKATFIVLSKDTYTTNGTNEVDAMVGDVNIFFTDPSDHSLAEIEIMIAETHFRGKGYGYEACLLMMLYGCTELNIKTYQAKIGHSNIPSRNLFEKKLNFEMLSYSDVFKEVTLEFKVTQDFISSIQEKYLPKWISYCKLKPYLLL